MLTRRGWGLVIGAGLLATTGRALGTLELYVLAAGAFALVGLALASVRMAPMDLEGARLVRPERAGAGDDVRVEVRVTNRSRRRTPPLILADWVGPDGPGGPVERAGPRRVARFHVARLGPGQSARAEFRVGAERGRYRIGPLELAAVDPFALARRPFLCLGQTTLTVFPRVDPLSLPPASLADDHRSGPDRLAAVGPGDELYGLRPYQVGDDLRRVHWPATAHRDEMVVRQPEHRWQGRATVVLDTRQCRPGWAFEAAVSAAASLVSSASSGGLQVRLVTTTGFDSGFGRGRAHLDVLMDHLATVEPEDAGQRGPDGAWSAVQGHRGTLVAVWASPLDPALLGQLDRAASTSRWVAAVFFGPTPGPPHGPPAAGSRTLVVPVGPGQPFADAWGVAIRGVATRGAVTQAVRR